MISSASLPRQIFSGYQQACHVQGIAVDSARQFIYFSFTTSLVKTDLSGRLIGSVHGLLGHLGCITFNEADGRVYGSLEYKHDCIGEGILHALHQEDRALQESFYCAIFDVDKIDRPNMDAERDGIMTSVFLRDVTDDYLAQWEENGHPVQHRYGCSGIDGISFGPEFGAPRASKPYLNITYGVYSDLTRTDNDYQVLVHYDTAGWRAFEQPLSQRNMHQSGPEHCDEKYFVFTGNTSFGVQNLEYDPYTGNWLMCVYRGQKPQFPNDALYLIDGSVAPTVQPLRGLSESGKVLALVQKGAYHAPSGVYGFEFPLGSTGVEALGDGYYYFSQNGRKDGQEYSMVSLYRLNEQNPLLFEPVADEK